MRIKTSELQRVALRWAVAKCEGFSPFTDGISWIIEDKWASGTYKQLPYYLTDWAQGGPIIERERLHVMAPIIHRIGKERHALPVNDWRSMRQMPDETVIHGRGPTGLIAAMRCYVASKLGEYVDVPDEVQS